jgi:esterase
MDLYHKMYGHGYPTIILHGVFGMLDNWHHFARLLSEDFWVITIDQRNHGRSGHSEEFNFELMVEDLRQFLISHQIKKCNLIGHSMGGKVAMNFALEHHEFINKLIVIDIGIKSYPLNHDFILDALCSIDLLKFKDRKDIENDLKRSITSESIVHFLLKNVTRDKDSGLFKWKMNLKSIRKNYNLLIEAIESDYQFDGDTLFIKGENSNYITEDDMPEIRKIFPQAKFETIKDAGHWVHAEQELKLVFAVKMFLK